MLVELVTCFTAGLCMLGFHGGRSATQAMQILPVVAQQQQQQESCFLRAPVLLPRPTLTLLQSEADTSLHLPLKVMSGQVHRLDIRLSPKLERILFFPL